MILNNVKNQPLKWSYTTFPKKRIQYNSLKIKSTSNAILYIQ